jgi:hypothetical protein
MLDTSLIAWFTKCKLTSEDLKSEDIKMSSDHSDFVLSEKLVFFDICVFLS